MIYYVSDNEKEMCSELWREAFSEDSEEFIDYYFAEKTKNNKILVKEESGRILSMVHRNPYLLHAGNRTWQCDYIVGVATAGDRRKRGYMRELLTRAMHDMCEEKMPFCFLMPASEQIYLPFGFTWIFNQPQRYLDRSSNMQNELDAKRIDTVDDCQELEQIAEWMQEWLSTRYEVYAHRDAAYVSGLLSELASEKGFLESLYKDGQMVGLYGEWGNKDREQRLLYAEQALPLSGDGEKPAIMGRIIHLPEFIKIIRLQPSAGAEELELTIQVADPILAENNRTWFWHLDCAGSSITPVEDNCPPDISITIKELTSWLFGYTVPVPVQKYNDSIRTVNGVFLDEIV